MGKTHDLRLGLVMDYTTSYFPYSEIDHIHLSIEAQCVIALLPLGYCHSNLASMRYHFTNTLRRMWSTLQDKQATMSDYSLPQILKVMFWIPKSGFPTLGSTFFYPRQHLICQRVYEKWNIFFSGRRNAFPEVTCLASLDLIQHLTLQGQPADNYSQIVTDYCQPVLHQSN